MDLCVIDWKAFTPIIASLAATGIASSTALYISNRWRKQKGGEVIASEAKEAIYKIKELTNHFKNNLNNFDITEIDKLKIDFEIIYREIVHKLDFLFQAINDKNDKHLIIEFIINLNQIYVFRISKMDFETKSILDQNELYKEAANMHSVKERGLINVLMSYALYEKYSNK